MSGIQPCEKCRQAALPSVPENPTSKTFARMKKLATFDPDAMKAAGVNLISANGQLVDFGNGVTSVSARLACLQGNGGNCGGTLEFHLDSNAGALIASITIPSTGGFQTWQTTQPATVSGASGVHDSFLVFKAAPSGTTGLGNVNWFKFN